MKKIGTLALVAVCAAGANATVLTFSDLALANYGAVPQAYGDNVTSVGGPAPDGTYEIGNGWTPNVVTSYQSLDPSGSLSFDYVDYWNTSYGDLTDVIFCAQSNGIMEVTLTADAGYHVVLDSFDAGAWPNSDRAAGLFQVTDGVNVLWDQSGSTIHGVGTHDHYAPGLNAQSLTIRLGYDWNNGLDNISFHQEAAPEPMTLAVLGVGAAALLRRKRK